MRSFVIALQFLTIFPIKRVSPAPRELGLSMAFFPIVGALLGLLVVLSGRLFSGYLPLDLTAALVLLILVASTGGLHLDGFADTVDGLAGGRDPQERLRIMRDRRTGAIGAASLVLLLLIKYLALRGLYINGNAAAVFLVPVVGRWSAVPMAWRAVYAREGEGLGRAFSGLSVETLFTATVTAFVLTALFMGPWSIAVFLFLGGFAYIMTRFFCSMVGGVTGDIFGFQIEVSEALFMILVLAMWRS